MEIYVLRGLGYITVESRESSKHEIGYVEMDSIFSPILSVGINVESVRVGKMTNWDKLIINLATDGTITPEEAFYKAIEILIAQFGALKADTEKTKEETQVVAGTAADAEEKKEEKESIEATEKKTKKRGRPKKN